MNFEGSDDLNGDCCRNAGDIRLDCLNESEFAELSTLNWLRQIGRRCLPWTAGAAAAGRTGTGLPFDGEVASLGWR